MNRDDFIQAWTNAALAGTLLTSKHNPSGLPAPQSRFRTVTCMPPNELAPYIAAGNYAIRLYTNHNPYHSPQFCELVPRDASIVPGSGVPPMSTTPTTACDRFVAVCGARQGWHLYAEAAASIRAKEQRGELTLTYEFL
jgi:hypothetical protein